ncbi:43696_t:CDS:1, partial [Gigaspora margarita]
IPNFRYKESSDDDSDDSENDTSELTNDSSQNTPYLIKSMCHIIYNSLFDYWNKPIMVGLLATLLDPQLKMLSNWDLNTQERAKAELTRQFKNIETPDREQTISIYTTFSNSNNIRRNRLHFSIF